VNKNNFIHRYNKNDDWSYSSLLDYLGKKKSGFLNMNAVLGQFKSINEYEEYLKNNALYMKEKKEMEEYLIEE